MAQQIEITIAEDGGTTIEVKGAKGRSCIDLTKELEKELGAVTDDRKTKEYYQSPQRSVEIGGKG